MSGIDPLAQLRDIHSPPPVGWWPPAPGWWLMAAFFVIASIAGGVWLWRHYHQRRYRRLALQQLHALYREHQAQPDNSHFADAINRLLKQCALAAFPRSNIAALSGAEWLDFLDRHLRKPRFTDPDLRALANLYQPTSPAIAPDTLRDAAEYWIRRHRC